MNDNRPEIESIIDLSTDDLAPEEADRLERSLNPEALAELASQRAARQALERLHPPPGLSDDEQRRLRMAVRSELRLERSNRRAGRRRPRARSPIARAFPALGAFAALILVVAIAVTSGDRLEFGQDDSLEAPATTSAATTRVAMETETVAEAEAAAAAEEYSTTETTGVPETDALTQAEAEAEAEAAAAAAEAASAETAMAALDATESEDELGTGKVEVEAGELPEVTDTTNVSPSDRSSWPPILFEASSSSPREAVRRISAVISDGLATPLPVHDFVEQPTAPVLLCFESAASIAEREGAVYFLAGGLVDGGDAEAYLLVDDPISDDAFVFPERIDSQDILLYSLPDCTLILLPDDEAG